MIEVGKSYTGDELRELAGNEGSERVWAFAFEKEGKDIIVVCEDEGNGNWKVLRVMGQEETEKPIYQLVRDDVLEVANAMHEELTEDEMDRVKSGVEDGFGNHWWDIVESVIDDVIAQRHIPEPSGGQ